MQGAHQICLEDDSAPYIAPGGCGPGGAVGEWTEGQSTGWFRPIVARTRTIRQPIGPFAYDCVKIIVVRTGSAVLYCRHFGERFIGAGDAVIIGPGVLVGSEPEESHTVTTLYLDTDYVIDHLYWQYVGLLHDRISAQWLAESLYDDPAQILHLGEELIDKLAPWLDELVCLSVRGAPRPRFHRMQSLWLAIADEVTPFVRMTSTHSPNARTSATKPSGPRYRKFAPVRREALAIQVMLHSELSHPWTLAELARKVHLSERQVSRLYLKAFGKTPLAHLRLLRVQEMARLLSETDISITQAAHAVGWRSRNHAAEIFRKETGITPDRYRKMNCPTRDPGIET